MKIAKIRKNRAISAQKIREDMYATLLNFMLELNQRLPFDTDSLHELEGITDDLEQKGETRLEITTDKPNQVIEIFAKINTRHSNDSGIFLPGTRFSLSIAPPEVNNSTIVLHIRLVLF